MGNIGEAMYRRGAAEQARPAAAGERIRHARWSGAALLGAALALALVIAVLHAANGSTDLTSWWYGNLLLALALTAPGALIAQRRPDNPIGWLLCVAGLSEGLCGAGREYLVLGALGHHAPASLWLGWLCDALYQVSVATLPLMLVLFPTGRLLSRRWKLVVVLVPAGLACSLIGYLFNGDIGDARGHRIVNPAADVLPSGLTLALGYAGLLVIVACLLSSATAIVLRYLRAEGAERDQIKWVAWAGSIAMVEILTELVPVNPYANVTGGVVTVLLAASLAVAVLRYRLLDIDVVIARTLVFATLSAAVVGAYLLVVLGLGSLLGRPPHLGLPFVATAVVSVAFAPLRVRVQRGVDRLVYGDRSDPFAVMTRLGRRIGTSGPGELRIIVETVAHALKLPYAALLDRDGVVVAEIGDAVGPLQARELRYGDQSIGELRVSQRSRRDRFGQTELRLLDDLAPQVATAIHAVTVSADLQASRHRLVTAKEEERRRLRRDLHDGLGPRLAALGLKLDAAGLMADSRPGEVGALIATVKDDIRGTLDEIRRLVRGLRPPALDQLGLVGALRDWASRLDASDTTSGVRFTIEGPDAELSLPAAVEVAAFWIATEAMTNVVRHAGARCCSVRLERAQDIRGGADELLVEVIDDGVGLAPGWRAGVGTTSMAERAGELGGSCDVRPGDAGGTRVVARLPLGDGGGQ